MAFKIKFLAKKTSKFFSKLEILNRPSTLPAMAVNSIQAFIQAIISFIPGSKDQVLAPISIQVAPE